MWQGPRCVQADVSGASASRPTTRSTGHECQPSASNARATRSPAGPMGGAGALSLRGRGPRGSPGPPREADAPLVERVPGCKLVIRERPVVRHPVVREHPEVLRPKTRRMGCPVDRAAADTVADEGLDGGRVVLNRVVGCPATNVRVGVESPFREPRALGRVGRDTGVVEPTSTLDAHDPHPGRRQPPGGRGAGRPGADDGDLGRDVSAHG